MTHEEAFRQAFKAVRLRRAYGVDNAKAYVFRVVPGNWTYAHINSSRIDTAKIIKVKGNIL